jgi:hypothetical protein
VGRKKSKLGNRLRELLKELDADEKIVVHGYMSDQTEGWEYEKEITKECRRLQEKYHIGDMRICGYEYDLTAKQYYFMEWNFWARMPAKYVKSLAKEDSISLIDYEEEWYNKLNAHLRYESD